LAELLKIDEQIPAEQVRHCSLPWLGIKDQRNDGRVLRLSTWDDDRAVHNIYFVADDAKAALMLVCQLRRVLLLLLACNTVCSYLGFY